MFANFIIEVQVMAKSTKGIEMFYHVGYVNRIFQNVSDACEYYRVNNTHMRSLDQYSTKCSGVDPVTNLRYVIREYNGEFLSIEPWQNQDKVIFKGT